MYNQALNSENWPLLERSAGNLIFGKNRQYIFLSINEIYLRTAVHFFMVFFSGSMHKNLEQTCKGDKRLTAEFPALLFKITCHFSPCFRTFLKFTSFSNSIVGKIKAFKRQSFSTFIHEMKGNCNKLKYWNCRKTYKQV